MLTLYFQSCIRNVPTKNAKKCVTEINLTGLERKLSLYSIHF